MALRLIEVFLPQEHAGQVAELVADPPPLGLWHMRVDEGQAAVRILVDAERSEAVLDGLESRFKQLDGFRVLLLPVEAAIPRPAEPPEAAADLVPPAAPESAPAPGPPRISREELYADIADTIRLSGVYLMMVVLSSIVAAVGLLRGNVAVIVGAMVVAPLLGPNVALALATTLADTALARTALKANAAGLIVGLAISLAVGLLIPVDPQVAEIASRTRADLSDVVLALAAGSAGALAFTSGYPATLIGVMVAVALLPPLVTFGLLTGSGHAGEALGALLLLASNIICVNLAGVVTFLARGIRPLTWWEADRARRAARAAVALWLGLLVVLVGLIVLARRT
jgi:uncharacterized hydrophobic protein (TIGR00341 family)